MLARCFWTFVLVVGGGGLVPGVADASAADRLVAVRDDARSEVRLRFDDRAVLTYAYGADRIKPAVIHLGTLEGVPVVRDAPADHLHHHGLMYAVKVNDVNFWEERGDVIGRQVSAAEPRLRHERMAGGRERVVLRHRLRWEAPAQSTNPGPLLQELRVLEITADAAHGELAILWHARFEVARGLDRVRVHGTDYNGLGLRLPEGFDRVAEFSNADGIAYSAAQARDVTETRWTAVRGRSEGREVMLTLAGPHPADGPAAFFTMRNPFAYLAATQRLDRAPREWRARQPVELRHLLLVSSAPRDRDALEKRWAEWSP